MGGVLCAPIRSQLLSRVGDARFRVGSAMMQGFRCEMEDAHCSCLQLEDHPDVAFFGVYDGHAGSAVSKYLAEHLHVHVNESLKDRACSSSGPKATASDLSQEDLDDCLRKAVVKFDMLVCQQPFRSNGSTCVFALLRRLRPPANGSHEGQNGEKKAASADKAKATTSGGGGGGDSWEVVAVNVGDSRAMVVRADGSFVSLTEDHKPSNPQERERIGKAGGFVQQDRVDGSLAMSRAIGDFSYKDNPSLGPLDQKVIALPEIRRSVVHPGDRVLVICDGVVEHLSNRDVARYVHDCHSRHKSDPAQVMRELLFHSLAKGSTDNQSATLVCLEDGSGYDAEDEFIAGPLQSQKHDRAFITAYLKNAKAWGQTVDSLQDQIRQADVHMPQDWRQHGKHVAVDNPSLPLAKTMFFAMLCLTLFIMSTQMNWRRFFESDVYEEDL
eukprot:TRINITY_DN28915_c0_g1_i1.p1 TRINITY_DN28915_c0_g1~~TRINITY_DN28915_c0_g1_i1.p1  ORF type:complete len:459 (-),score=108.96 TRINITY_DN28915_c0_g1_i1:208-1530(-)